MNARLAARFAIAAIALFGAYSGFTISAAHMAGESPCPTFGPVPACYVVFSGYSLIAAYALFQRCWLYWLGWLPVFLLAASGVAAEILSSDPICPRSNSGIPQCFVSFAIAMTLIALFWFANGKRGKRST